MQDYIDVLKSAAVFFFTLLGQLFSYISPMLSGIAISCAAILGLHGVYKLIRGKSHNEEMPHIEGNHHGQHDC